MKFQFIAPSILNWKQCGEFIRIVRHEMRGGQTFPWNPEDVLTSFFSGNYLTGHGYLAMISHEGDIHALAIIQKVGKTLVLCNQWGREPGIAKDLDEALCEIAKAEGCTMIQFTSIHTAKALERKLSEMGYRMAETVNLVRKEVQ